MTGRLPKYDTWEGFFLLRVLNIKPSEWEETFGKYLDTAKLQICTDQKAGFDCVYTLIRVNKKSVCCC